MPKQINILEEVQITELLPMAHHGDMFFKSGGIRSAAVFFVQAFDVMGNTISKTLIQKDETGSGYSSIPLAITLHFEDPLKEFLPLLANKEMGVRKTDWYTIELDTIKHAKILTDLTNGKVIAKGRSVVYFISGEFAPGYFIFNPDTPEEKVNVWKKLNSAVDEKYLGNEVYYLTEVDFEKIRSKNRKIYETKFIKWLELQTAETPLNVENIPTDINHKENTITQNQSTAFVSLQRKEGASVVNTRMREYTDWNDKGERNFIDIDLVFAPKYLSETGQWGKVFFWVNEQKNLYLIVPIWDESFKKVS